MRTPKFETKDGSQENIIKLAELFPGVVSDGKVNLELLKSMLGEKVHGDEAYEFTWVGKKESILETAAPIRKTLRPYPKESRNWDTTQNLYIEGDNLEVLKLLQESYLGKVKMIYIDPPYNTGNDFIYRDDFSQSLNDYEVEAGVFNENNERLFKNTETNGRFHSDWCSMIYPRLILARNLLRDDGVIFISIDDNEVAQLRKICDEVFGESNFIAELVWQRAYAPKNDAKYISKSHDYILMYCKGIDSFEIGRLPRTEEANARYSNPDNDVRGVWKASDLSAKRYTPSDRYKIQTPSGRVVEPPSGRSWSLSQKAYIERLNENRIWFGQDGNSVPQLKRFLSELKHEGMAPQSILFHKEVGHSQEGAQELNKIMDGGYFDGPKPVRLINRLSILANLTNEDIVLDFFSGSATTAHSVMQLNAEDGGNRKFIMVQLQEQTTKESEAYKAGYTNICEIGKERIRRAGDMILNDLINIEAGNASKGDQISIDSLKNKDEENDSSGIDLDIGFRVLKLDETNMRDVYYSADRYSQDLLMELVDNVKEGRNDLDLLYGCLLDWGLSLSMPHKSEVIDEFTIHTYNEGDLIACFDKNVNEKVVREIAKRQPLRAVFRDMSFRSSPDKINIFTIFKLLAPQTDVKVI